MEKYTKYEKARIIGARALQISMGAPFMIKLADDDLKRIKYNTVEIAKMEFEKDLIPITIKRVLPHESKKKIQKEGFKEVFADVETLETLEEETVAGAATHAEEEPEEIAEDLGESVEE